MRCPDNAMFRLSPPDIATRPCLIGEGSPERMPKQYQAELELARAPPHRDGVAAKELIGDFVCMRDVPPETLNRRRGPAPARCGLMHVHATQYLTFGAKS